MPLFDFNRMTGVIVQAGYNHFGMKIIGNYLGKIGLNLNIFSAYILGAFLFLCCVLFVICILYKFEPLLLQRLPFLGPIKTLYIFRK